MIPFNVPYCAGGVRQYVSETIKGGKFSGDGKFTKKCNLWLESHLECKKALLTTSGTHALEMAAILTDIKPGDEVIMPSFTFVSTANAFILRGARAVFVDIRPDTMNIDENLIKNAITKKTKAVVVVHYGGIACEMDEISRISKRHKLILIEDAAQAIMSKYKGKYLGTIGDIGCISFHETKNIQCGEGGAVILNKKKLVERAEIVREKGTDRSKFFRGEVNKYTWCDIGSSYLPSELNASFLFAQLKYVDEITKRRVKLWKSYNQFLGPLAKEGKIEFGLIPDNCSPNGHMFFIKTKNLKERTDLIAYLKSYSVMSVFHYIPLHTSRAGKKYGRFNGNDRFTTRESERLLRLPMYYNLKIGQVEYICQKIREFYLK